MLIATHCGRLILHKANLSLNTGMLREPFGWGVVNLNLFEAVWLVSCSIVADYYSFQCLKAIIFSYLHAVETGGQAWLLKTFNVLDIL